MLLTDTEVNTRLESPLNLINRINKLSGRSSNSMSLFVPGSTNRLENKESEVEGSAVFESNDSTDNEIDDIIPDNAQKIKLGLVKAKALDVLHDSLNTLHTRLGDVEKVKDYSRIASDMNKILTVEDSKKSIIGHQVIVYKPIVNDINKYETLVVNE